MRTIGCLPRDKGAAGNILKPLSLALIVLLTGGLPLAAQANCTIGATSATCDSTSPNPFTKPTGDGTQSSLTAALSSLRFNRVASPIFPGL
jgi:hypothetical protein